MAPTFFKSKWSSQPVQLWFCVTGFQNLDWTRSSGRLESWERTVVCNWHFNNLWSHLQSQVIVLVFVENSKNPYEWFDWSIARVAIGMCVMWLAVKTCAEIGYANRLLYLLINQIAHQGFWIFNWLKLSLDSKDGFHTGCQNVSHIWSH